MGPGGWTALDWLAFVEHELLLFAGIFFLIGALDELAVDAWWAWLRLSGRRRTGRVPRKDLGVRRLDGRAAIFIPVWQEGAVIEHTLTHALGVWVQRDFVIYVGCYCNDEPTLAAAMRGAGGDPRVRLVINDRAGPTTKADCLNRLYAAMEADERRCGRSFRMVLIHDAEDMVDPAELGLMDIAISNAEFVQLPVLPLPQPGSRWIGSHYCEEFAEAHGKSMVVRGEMAAGLPSAGVGCAFDRAFLAALGQPEPAGGPFSVDSLTEDYELGMRIRSCGGRSRFLRVRGEEDGTLVATRAFFPSRVDLAVRQKARWIHGIAFQGWDRLGWEGGLGERWMRLRDRRGPMTALVLACGYTFFMLATLFWLLAQFGTGREWQGGPWVTALIAANLVGFAWRMAMRFAFTAREYGAMEGLRAVLRIPVTNAIAILAGRRALFAYIRTLGGASPQWDKTEHESHPAALQARTSSS